MQAAAARVGAPLGHDFCVISLSDILKPWDVVERRLRAAGEADLVLALYNPASRTRREQLARALEILREYRAPSTPVVVARAVGSDAEAVTVTTLSELDLDAVDMRTLLIVGSSATRVVGPHVYTPRPLSMSLSPRKRAGDAGDHLAIRARRPPHDDHRQPAPAGRVELCLGQVPAAVLRYQEVDPVAVDQLEFAGERVRPAVEQQLVVGRQRRLGFLDAPDQEPRVSDGRERREPLTASREQHPPTELRDECGGLREPGYAVPAVAGTLAPPRTLEPQERHLGSRASVSCRSRDPLGERMRGVDHRADPMLEQPVGEGHRAAEAANAHLAARQARVGYTAGERADHVDALNVERICELARLRCSAEDEDHR